MAPEIIQVVQEFGTRGGSSSVAYEIAMALARAGVANGVITNVVSAPADKVAVEQLCTWLGRIPIRGRYGYLGRVIVFPLFTIAATLAVRRAGPAIVVNHGDCLSGDVLVVHAVNAENLAIKRGQGAWTWIFNPMHLWVHLRDRLVIGGRRCKAYVAVSERVSEELRRHYDVPSSRIHVIPNGVNLEKFRTDRRGRDDVRDEFGIPAGAKLLLFVSHEFNRKGLAYAIEALELLGEDFRLLVVGSDASAPYRALARTASDRLIFAGPRDDMPSLYAAADAFVLPTDYETFSLVCIEAMASGVPVLATRVGGIEDYLVDGLNGYAIERDPRDIAHKIGLVFADPTRYAAMRLAARTTAERYSWDRTCSMYVELCRQLAAERHTDKPR